MLECPHYWDERDPNCSLVFGVSQHAKIGFKDVLSTHVDEPYARQDQREYQNHGRCEAKIKYIRVMYNGGIKALLQRAFWSFPAEKMILKIKSQ